MFRWRHSIASAETLSFLLPSTVFYKIDSNAVALIANVTVDTGETPINTRNTVSKTKDPKNHSDILKRGPSLVYCKSALESNFFSLQIHFENLIEYNIIYCTFRKFVINIRHKT